jgi:hypothetical protein
MTEKRSRLAGTVLAIVIAASAAACGASEPSPTPSASGAASFDEYATAFCSAWATMFRVVGNPESATWTDAVHDLQAAAEAGDDASAASLQGTINTELEVARGQIAFAAAWPPAARMMAEMDRLFVAEQTWITAYVNIAKGVPDAPDAQAAFESAGGLEAWQAMFHAHAELNPHRPASVSQCPGLPIGP